jgi:Tfp pilus assembly protein PilO
MSRSAWRKYLWVWLVPALVLLLDGLWLFGFRSTVLGRGASVVQQVREKEQQRRELERAVAQLAATKERLRALEEDLKRLRGEEMGTMRARLVPFLLEVGERTRRAGLFPERIGYSVAQDKKSGLVHFAATFELSGSYEQLRQCVRELEQAPQFLVIERLGLRGEELATRSEIALQMVVGTYFADMDRKLLAELGAEEVSRAAE